MKKFLLVIIFPLLLSGCFVTGGGDSGKLSVIRDDERRIVEVKFEQPEGASEASTFVFSVSTNGVISGETYMGTQYDRVGIAETFRAFQIWHYAGVGLVLMGIGLFIARKFVPSLALVPKTAPWSLVGGGIICAVIGHIIPAYGKYIALAAGIIAVIALIYVVWKNRNHLGYEGINP